ncbi:MAG: hypothetical protein R3F31_14775 [Verrucomicrobiales bacterium]
MAVEGIGTAREAALVQDGDDADPDPGRRASSRHGARPVSSALPLRLQWWLGSHWKCPPIR